MHCAEEKVLSLVGIPFADGGRGPESFDCWGLVREVYRRYGINLPDYNIGCYDILNVTAEMERNRHYWREHKPPEIPVPSVVAFRVSAPMINHVGIYIGDGKFLHTREKAGAVIESLNSPVWRHRIEGFYTPCEQT